MLRGRAIIVLSAAFAIFASGTLGLGTTAADGATGTYSVARAVSLEDLLLGEINVLRSAHGLRPFAASTDLARAAVGHSRSMAVGGFFAHESQNGAAFWQRVRRFYVPRSASWMVGENLAMFGGVAPSANAIVAAWMSSPPHRANLLQGVFREAGIGIIHNPSAGGVFGGRPTWIITLDFGRR